MKLGMRITSHARHGIWRRSCNHIEGLFRAFATGSVPPFTMVFSSPKLLFVTNPNGICEIRSHAIRIVSVVIVGVAVGVDIAEIVVVVVIRGTQPPPGRQGRPNTKEHIFRNTPNNYLTLFALP